MRGRAENSYLVFTSFVSGTIVMVVELIGSRVIGPPFGVSLFVWTSLITVTLVSLALGYWVGGRLADRSETSSALFLIILFSGLYLAAVPLIKGTVIFSTLSLGLRAGSLTSSTVLFGPPLFLLGMVTPYVVKLYMASGSSGVGRTVGWLYAVSTFGSFLGTVLTGFVLIPSIGVNRIIYLSSLVLVLLTAGYLVIFRRRYASLAAIIIPAALLLVPERLPTVLRPDGTRVSTLLMEDSAYGQLKVVDYSYDGARLREFLGDNIVQGAIDLASGASLSHYTYYIERLSRIYNPGARNALVIGLGAGIIPRELKLYYGISTDAVEINGKVVKAANEHFRFNNAADSIYIGDGRYCLLTTCSTYDIIVLDAFSGDMAPGHLMSVEAFRLAKRRLSEGGVLLINFVAGNQAEDMAVPSSLARTLKEVFRHVDAFANGNFFSGKPAVVNIAFVAYDKDPPGPDVEGAGLIPVYPPLKEDVEGIFSRRVSFADGPFLFTDDYNPIDFYDVRLREKWRDITIRSTDRDIVVN